MSKAEKSDVAMVRARVLVSGIWGECNDIIEIEANQTKELVGVVDPDPAAVEYALKERSERALTGNPTAAELFAARDQLMQRERELEQLAAALAEQKRANDVEAERLKQQGAFNDAEAERLAGLAAANEAEAQRLRSWAATLESEAARGTALVTPAATETQTETPTEAPDAAPKAGKAK